MRASAHWALGQHDKALADYNQAIELGYKEPHAYASRGIFQAATGHPQEAVADFTAALEKDAKDTSSLINRAAAYMALGQATKAGRLHQRYQVGREEPDPAATTRHCPEGCRSSRRCSQRLHQGYRTESKGCVCLDGAGFVYFQLGQHAGAIDNFTRVIQEALKWLPRITIVCYNYQQLGKCKEALDDYNKAIELAPKYGLALQNKAWLLVLSKDESLRDAKTAVVWRIRLAS